MKKLKHIISNFDEWNDKVLRFIYEFYGDKKPEFIDDTKTFYTQKQIYILFSKNYNELIVKFDAKDKFINALQLALIEYLPQLYISSLAFVNDEFQKLLDETNRGDIQKGTTFGTTKQKNKQGIPPSDLQVKDDLAELHIKNAEFMENFGKNETNAQVLNLLGNLKQIINSKITSKIFEWLNNFAKLFSPLICDEFEWVEPLTDILHELRDKVEMLEAIIDADKLQDLYTEIQLQLQALKDELDVAIENAKNQNIENLQETIKTLQTKYDAEIKKIWDYMDDNDGLLKKFEELYNQTQVENNQLEQKLDTKIQANTSAINDLDKTNIAYVNKENTFIAPQNIKNSRNINIIRFTQSTSDNAGGISNPNGRLILGGKNGISLSSTISYDATTAITQPKQLTTKAYVDNAVEQAKIEGIDLSNYAKINESNIFTQENEFRIIPKVKENDGAILLPVSGASLTPKAYVDNKIKYTKCFRHQTYLDWIKSDIVSKLYNYALSEQQKINISIPQELISKNVTIYAFCSAIQRGKTLFEGVLAGFGYINNIRSDYQLPLNNINVISSIDLRPGASGKFNAYTFFEILIIEN